MATLLSPRETNVDLGSNLFSTEFVLIHILT